MKRILYLLAFTFFALGARTSADSPRTPEPLVFVSTGLSAVFFTLAPDKIDDKSVARSGRGVMYRLKSDGSPEEMYRTEGWFSFSVYVSRDGRYLVQMGPWNEGRQPSKEHLAIAFHKDGNLMKSYAVTDLVKDPTQVRQSISHYQWQGPPFFDSRYQWEVENNRDLGSFERRIDDSDGTFTIFTSDAWKYVFDFKTGEIKSAKNLLE